MVGNRIRNLTSLHMSLTGECIEGALGSSYMRRLCTSAGGRVLFRV